MEILDRSNTSIQFQAAASAAFKRFAKQNLALAEFTSAKEGHIRGPHETPFHGAGDIIEAFTMEEIPQ